MHDYNITAKSLPVVMMLYILQVIAFRDPDSDVTSKIRIVAIFVT